MARLDPVAFGFEQEHSSEAESESAFDHESAGQQAASVLNARFAGLTARELVERALTEIFPGRIALVSSFGAESAVLLHLVASIDRSIPVVFMDTLRLFPETLAYRDQLVERLGLTEVRTITPDPAALAAADPHKALWMLDADACCRIRKTEPLARAMEGFDAWFTGRKRFQAATRSAIQAFEQDGDRIKVNPLAAWTIDDLKAYVAEHELPPHPLVANGYPSIGCVPCTSKVKPGEDARAGRWRGLDKTECGIHLGLENDGSGI
jgi:phosphoadenosine phosphosulfate reductase